jgi:hypothetical protein
MTEFWQTRYWRPIDNKKSKILNFPVNIGISLWKSRGSISYWIPPLDECLWYIDRRHDMQNFLDTRYLCFWKSVSSAKAEGIPYDCDHHLFCLDHVFLSFIGTSSSRNKIISESVDKQKYDPSRVKRYCLPWYRFERKILDNSLENCALIPN